ncbi:adenosine receptor A2b-like [Littorina saxatilis]|uniref:adenosine receptor A2b-like n=1 Tax=Littorina saxatilis TaxID=31220 RepID=UPI0038B650BF
MDLGNSSDWETRPNAHATPIPELLERNGWELGDTIYSLSQIVLGILTVLVNSLVPLALWRHKQLRSRTNYYICNLAVAGILEGLCVPTLSTVSHAGLPKSFHGCVFMNSILTVFANVTVLSLVCVAFDRFLSINSPLYHYCSSTPISVAILTAAAWVVGTLNGLIPLMGWHKDPQGFTTCSFRRVIPLTYSVYVNFFGFLVPILFLVMVFHIKMFFSFQAHNRKSNLKYGTGLSRKKSRRLLARQREIKLTKILSLIFVLFAVCYFPLQIISCIRMWSPDTYVSFDLIKFTVFLSQVNPLINPVIYAFNQPGFRNVLMGSLPACCFCLMKMSKSRASLGGKRANNEDEPGTSSNSIGLYTAFASSNITQNVDKKTQNGECLKQGPNSDLAEKELVQTGKNPSLPAIYGTAHTSTNLSKAVVRKTASLFDVLQLPFEDGARIECFSKDNGKEDTSMSSISSSLKEVSVYNMDENSKLSSSVNSEAPIAAKEGQQ